MKHPTAPISIGLGLALAIAILIVSVVALPAGPAQSREQDRTLKLYFGHTGERGEFTYKRNGRYDRGEMNRINQFLRDWRRNEPAKMDPQLLDLVWSIYKESGSRDHIHIISAYRSPATNKMLRSRSSGVAKNSQHMLGKAMDWYVPDVPLAKLRAAAMKMQGGGVGYYPRSGSPFVHTDTGSVRAWPRMSRQQLLALFPNGNTLHLPADGKPLPGYEVAVARRKAGSEPVLAYLETETTEAAETDRTGTSGSAAGWLRRVFPGDSQEDSDLAEAVPTTAPATEEPQLALTDTRPPRARPPFETPAADLNAGAVVAPADADAIALLAVPTLPRTRPDPSALADTLEPVVLASLEVNSEDAIAALTARVAGTQPAIDPSDSIELAFAAISEPPPPAAADRAILAAFAALDEAPVHEADAALTAAVTRRATDDNRPSAEPAMLALAFAGNEAERPRVIEPVVEPGSGIVLAPNEPGGYGYDAEVLVDLIQSPENAVPADTQFAMPTPQAELYVAPQGASQVTDLRGVSGPPVDRYVRNGAPSEQGFFSRLFASLIE